MASDKVSVLGHPTERPSWVPRARPVASTGVSAPLTPPGDHDDGEGRETNEEKAAAALHAAFSRLAPQGNDAWNFLAAFTHLGDRYGPYHPGTSGLSDLLGEPGPDRRTRRTRLARLRPRGDRPTADDARREMEEAMAQVVEAFRFLSARVGTLEQRLAHQDRPIDAVPWLVPAEELGPWAGPVAAHMVAMTPGGAVLHADCGEGLLLDTLAQGGVDALGVEPRGGVALRALERGCAVTICEALETLETLPSGTLGGVVLSGVVDRLALHELLPLLSQTRRALQSAAPIAVVATDPSGNGSDRGAAALELVAGRPLHVETWEILLDRAGFVDIAPLTRDGVDDGRFALSATTPS